MWVICACVFLKCVFTMNLIAVFTFGLHWITCLEVLCIFHENMTWSNNQWAAHLTHSIAYELNGLPIG